MYLRTLSTILCFMCFCDITNLSISVKYSEEKINEFGKGEAVLHQTYENTTPSPGIHPESHIPTEAVSTGFPSGNTQKLSDSELKMKSMYVSKGEIESLPTTVRIINLTITEGASIKRWGNCRYLEFFHLSNFIKEHFPAWPENCTKLQHLEITGIFPEIVKVVAEKMMAATPSLITLKITDCRLYYWPIKLISSAKNLIHLDLSNNELTDEMIPYFPFLDTLKSLDLSSNQFRGDGLGGLIPKLPTLKELTLDEEREFYRVCSEETGLKSGFLEHLQNSSIEYIDFGSTDFYLECFNGLKFRNLKHITMLSPGSPELYPINFPKTDAEYIEFDLGDSYFVNIWFGEKEYEILREENSSYPFNNRNLTIRMGFVRCDCDVGWLAKALRDFPHIISMPNLRCNSLDGRLILQEPIQHIQCNKTEKYGCFFRQNWRDGTVTAECDKDVWIWKLDHDYPIHGLNVSGKGITYLNDTVFALTSSNSIRWLDLRRNSISRASAAETEVMFAAGRRVWLADNMLLCDCDNRALLDAIQEHKDQVPDYDSLKCVATGDPISLISTDKLCQVAITASLSALGVMILIAGIMLLLLRRYGEHLRMFLYSRGWCISCLQRIDPDDKPYDAFISFAHEDREYVMQTLLPGLEDAPERFRVCVHYRDWLVGDWIPAQIMRSVQLSKRTLILLSRNFVASPWSTLEMRYSLANSEENPKAKVLLLVMDDVLEMNLDMELRRYLIFNTYMLCNDPWFWEKLRYAMPHRSKNSTKYKEFNDKGIRNNAMAMGICNVALNSDSSELG